jgi:pilus assembly protein Flp/PilA
MIKAATAGSMIRRLLGDESGATAIEYALLAAMLAILAIGGLQSLGGSTGSLYATMEEISVAIATAVGK